MNTSANYFRIGLFVIGTLGLLLVAVAFFGGRDLFRSKTYMETYFNESVQGLSVGAPVYFRGVQIGRVNGISFVHREYPLSGEDRAGEYGKYVMVQIAVDYLPMDDAPGDGVGATLTGMIEQGLRLRLKSHPLTGVAYVEADYLDHKRYPPLEIGWQPRTMYIPSAPSLMSTFTNTAEAAFQRLAGVDIEHLANATSELLNSLNKTARATRLEVLSAKAIDLVSELQETNKEVQALLRTTNSKLAAFLGPDDGAKPAVTLENLLASLDSAVKDAQVGEVSSQVRALLPELRETNKQIQALLRASKEPAPEATIEQAIARLDKTVGRAEGVLAGLGPRIGRTMTSLDRVIANMRLLTDDLRRHPSKLLFGQSPPKSRTVK